LQGFWLKLFDRKITLVTSIAIMLGQVSPISITLKEHSRTMPSMYWLVLPFTYTSFMFQANELQILANIPSGEPVQ
jgi:hypothetical protein